MKLTYTQCDAILVNFFGESRPCNSNNGPCGTQGINPWNFTFTKLNGKDYCNYCIEREQLKAKGLVKCKYCWKGTCTEYRNDGYSYNPTTREQWKCTSCDGTGIVKIGSQK